MSPEELPDTEKPATEKSPTVPPVTEQPSTEQSVTVEPESEQSVTEHAATEKPAKTVDEELRKDLLKALATFLPTLLIAMSGAWLKTSFTSEPGQALWLIIPGLVFVSLFYVRKRTRQQLNLGWPFLVFLPVYILVFFIAAESRVLDWTRTLTGHENTVPRNFLALNSFGDWHYWVVSEKPAKQDMGIVLMKRPETIEIGRLQIADLIEYAKNADATGVAFDVYFSETGEEGDKLNRYLCDAIEKARKPAAETRASKKELPIFVGYDFRLGKDRIERVRIDNYLEGCLPTTAQGHTVGYREADNVVRSVPMQIGESLGSFSLLIAEELAKMNRQQIQAPPDGLLQFTKPANDFKTLKWNEVWNNYLSGDEEKIAADQAEFQDRFVLVGEDSLADQFLTPYGTKPGVVVHAYAVHSLRQNQFVRRQQWWTSLLMISLLCYLLMVFTSRGFRSLKLILINVAFSVLIILIAVLAMRLWLTWIDLVYPLLATWLFLFLLLGLRKAGRKTAAAIG